MHKKLAMDLLKIHEGYSQYVYECSQSVKTVGYGRNLESRGLSEKEAEYLLRNDISEADNWCSVFLGYYDELSTVRKAVLIDMYVNLGATGLMKFRRMHKALENKDYAEASLEMLDSRWATQVGNRAIQLSQIMKDEIYV